MLEAELGQVEFQPSPFFAEQLHAFELWLEHGSQHKRPPEQLPIVLQVCAAFAVPPADADAKLCCTCHCCTP